MHGSKTIDPRIPTNARTASVFYPSGRHCLHLGLGAVRCSVGRVEDGLHPSKNRTACEGDFGTFVCTLLLTDKSFQITVLDLPNVQGLYWVPNPTSDALVPIERSLVLHPAENYPTCFHH